MRTILFSLLMILTSCARLPEFPVQGTFPGINSELACQNSMSLLIIHGLGGYGENDPDALIHQIQKKLKLCKVSDDVVYEIVKEDALYGSLAYADYEGINGSLRIYSLYWHDATELPRGMLTNIDQQTSCYRIPLMNRLKENYVDSAVADGLLYASSYRKVIQYPFEKTIEWIQAERPDDRIMVVGFSLGSTVLIETLDEMRNDIIAQNFIRQISEVFMLSNPAPLFDLAKLNCGNAEYDWQWHNWAVGRFVYEKRKSQPDFQIVAISDPNDALSYIVQDHYVPSECGWSNAFLNQKVRNVKWSFFGLINPITAHTAYGQNKNVQDMIIYGRNR